MNFSRKLGGISAARAVAYASGLDRRREAEHVGAEGERLAGSPVLDVHGEERIGIEPPDARRQILDRLPGSDDEHPARERFRGSDVRRKRQVESQKLILNGRLLFPFLSKFSDGRPCQQGDGENPRGHECDLL